MAQTSECECGERETDLVHPEVCRLAETLIAEVVKAPVEEHCNREGRPRCRFEVDAAKNRSA